MVMNGWQQKQVNELGEIITGRTPSTKRKDYYDGDYNLISPADLDNGKYIKTAHKRLTRSGFEQCRALPRSTVLVGCIGNVGKLGMVADDCSATNQQINALICNTENDPDFVYYCFHANKDRFERAAVKTTVPILNKTNFGNFELNIPTLPEQKKIAHILSTVQRAIEVQERIIQTTTELKKALMQKLFTEGLRFEPQKQTEIGPVPESWEVLELEHKAESFQYGTSVKCGYETEGKSVLRIPNVVGGHVDTSDLKYGNPKKNELGKLILQAGDLLFVRTNGVKENAGRCSMFNGELEDCYYASYLIRVRLDPKILNPVFLSEYSRTEAGTSFLSGRSIRTADGKFNINSSTLKTMLVPVPAIEEQEEIARNLAVIDNKAINAQAKKAVLQDLFHTLLHELMTAKIRVHETNLAQRSAEIGHYET